MIDLRIALFLLVAALAPIIPAAAQGTAVQSSAPAATGRTITADFVALDQAIFYNRFGSVNPYAMIYALRRDVVAVDGETGIAPGKVRLRDGKRPRPLVIRGNVGDTLEIRFTNLLRASTIDLSSCKPFTCSAPYTNLGEKPKPEPEAAEAELAGGKGDGNWPATRAASIAIPGLRALDPRNAPCTGLEAIDPGKTITCRYKLERQGAFLMSSLATPGGGEGDGGSANQGLFGVVNVEPHGSLWYRSQVDADQFDAAWKAGVAGGPDPTKPRPGQIEYNKLNLLEQRGPGRFELVSSDINAIIHECASEDRRPDCKPGDEAAPAYREFTVVFHDELKTFYADPFKVLADPKKGKQLQGVGDGFAINYGASGMGTALLANRKGIGPAADCVECVYEEFFLQSWANGDPALLEPEPDRGGGARDRRLTRVEYLDDPSNVHHSYLNDRVVFHNLHVGKETHVFHLHAHQWESLPEKGGRGSYLDSQTLGPGQAFSYEIYRGGLRHHGSAGIMQTNGSGNRNRTIGDSIFHCHLYPHFAQGMWALWRVHDVIEDGTRRLPDGQAERGPSVSLATNLTPRPGTDRMTGVTGDGTPIPAVVPLPGQALPPLPTYGANGMPGYPFYIAGKPGHRAPQPPLDIAKDSWSKPRDGGLPRHIVTGGTRTVAHLKASEIAAIPASERGDRLVNRALALADMTAELETAKIEPRAAEGEPLERNAMAFHAGAAPSVRMADGTVVATGGMAGYPSRLPNGTGGARFFVNGSPAAPGAPFADPCKSGGRWDPTNPRGNMRTYKVSAVQLDLVTNSAGWHDPQGRINVLDSQVSEYEGRTRGADPFYFRAESGECITFHHTNRTPKDLELDDFQVATPTDTIGQHIHLVKFDVTSSDGSGNGWNYEDGTFAPDAVFERMCAGNALVPNSFTKVSKKDCEDFHKLKKPSEKFAMALDKGTVQTTVQRWFADPLLMQASDGSRKDRTLGTIFTHDHFGPSSIQQHGFYSALLLEPKGSKWLKPDGKKFARDRKNSKAVGPAAIIKGADETQLQPDAREFALAIADFALLYDPRTDDKPLDRGLDKLIADARSQPATIVKSTDVESLAERRAELRGRGGIPIAAPFKPEAISTDHHDPYLVNYKGEPVPLRIGASGSEPAVRRRPFSCTEIRSGADLSTAMTSALAEKVGDVSHQRSGLGGDLAWAFASTMNKGANDPEAHGDPCTPLIEAYGGERVKVRLVQGAQEVQHTMNIEGLGFIRNQHMEFSPKPVDEALRDNPQGRVAALEVGISEHIELTMPAAELPVGGAKNTDYLYHFGSQDAIWNGAWGLLRSYGARRDGLKPLYGGRGRATYTGDFASGPSGTPSLCPNGGTPFPIIAVATRVDRLGGFSSGQRYRGGPGSRVTLTDRNGLILLPADERLPAEPTWEQLDSWIQAPRDGRVLSPFVARVRAGECIELRIINALRSKAEVDAGVSLDDRPGDALMPRITSLNVDDNPEKDGGAAQHGRVKPSAQLSFALPLVRQLLLSNTDRAIGTLINGMAPDNEWGFPPIQKLPFYAGLADTRVARSKDGEAQCGRSSCSFVTQSRPYAFGAIPLKPWGDFIGQVSHGLTGAIVVEPAGATFRHPANGALIPDADRTSLGTAAVVCTDELPEDEHWKNGFCPGGRGFREFVLMFEDGLNLHKSGVGVAAAGPVADCPVCDDSYDMGEKGISYGSEPSWARLNRAGVATNEKTNLNFAVFPNDFFRADRAGDQPTGTPPLRAREGETVKFRVVNPGGRARQRSFKVAASDYPDLLPFARDGQGDPVPVFGSPDSSLLAPGKAITATLKNVGAGCYIYFDGVTHILSGGAWGPFTVDRANGDRTTCRPPDDRP